jgi:hypothetical protein
MAKFLILIYGDEKTWAAWTEEQERANATQHGVFAEHAGPALIGGHELEPAAQAVSLRGAEKRTDGPYLPGKDVIGGFYLLEARDLDEAVALASRLPEVHADHSGVEIRPVKEPG